MNSAVAVPPGPGLVAGLREHTGRIALLTDEETIGYAELADRLDAVTDDLVGPRRLVLVAGRNRVPALVAYLAALRAGHAVLLAPGPDPGAVAALESAWDPDVVVDADGAVRVRRCRPRHALHPDLSLLLPTSGSTGSPRLVRLSASALDANAAAIVATLGITPDDRAATTLPLHYCYGLSVVHSNLLAGAGLLLGERSVTDPDFWVHFRARGGTVLHGVPHTFALLERVGFEEVDLPALRLITQAGGRLPPEQVRRWARLGARRGWRLAVMYGQTEATARMAVLPPELAETAPETIGRPVPGGHLEVADPDDTGVGELVYRGPNVMLGYASHLDDLAHGRTVEVLRTGDLGRRRPDGLVEVVGRRARFVKPFGVRVDLDAVERLLAEHGVQAAATARADRSGDGLVVGVVGAGPPGECDDPVRDLVAERVGMPPEAVAVVRVDELPRLASGKLDHPALEVIAAGAAPVVARTPDSVREVFARVFPGQDLPDDATFTDLGGDSLTYVAVSVELERVLQHLPVGWDRTPLGELAGRRSGARRRGATVETAVLLRALAIVLVVGEHVRLWSVLGGAHLLLALAGWTFARFLLPPPRPDAAGEPGSRYVDGPAAVPVRILRSAARVAVPASLWIAFRAATQDDVRWVDALLGGSLFHPLVQGYWFVDALVQILVLLAALHAVPAVRRLDRAHPLALPAVLLAAAVGLQLVPGADGAVQPDLYSTHLVLWLFLLGWLVQRADTARGRVVVALLILLLVVPFFAPDLERAAVVAGGLLLLALAPRVVVPRVAARPVGLVADASLAIYLTHFALLPLGGAGVPAPVLAGAALGTGVVVHRTATATHRAIRSRRESRGSDESTRLQESEARTTPVVRTGGTRHLP